MRKTRLGCTILEGHDIADLPLISENAQILDDELSTAIKSINNLKGKDVRITGEDINVNFRQRVESVYYAFKYMDTYKMERAEVGYFTLKADTWSGDTYYIEDENLFESSQDIIELTVDFSITATQLEALQAANIVGENGYRQLTLRALGTVPTIDIPIQLVVSKGGMA